LIPILRLIRERLKPSVPVVAMSSDIASILLQQLRDNGQFAIFQLPVHTAFVQAIRTPTGSLLIEVSSSEPRLAILLGRLGTVSRNELGFLAVTSLAGSDTSCGQVVALALSLLATSVGCENICRVRTGTSPQTT
jgi:hypothetical protein